VTVKSAELIKVDPDVRVVADADQPMFHIVGSYWLFHDASWWRSGSVTGPWVLEPHPPWQVTKIDQPYAFTRYRLQHGERTAKVETLSKDLGPTALKDPQKPVAKDSQPETPSQDPKNEQSKAVDPASRLFSF